MRRPRRPARRLGAVGALLLEGFGSRLAFGLLSLALPLYGRHVGLSLVEVGLLLSLSTLVALVLKPWSGRLVDRWGLRRGLLLALALRSVLSLGYLAAVAPAQLFAVRGAHGAADAVRDPAVHALLAEHADRRAVATTFGWYQTAKSTAGSLGKGFAGLLIGLSDGYGAVFVVAFVLSLLPTLAVLALVPPASARPADRPVPAPADAGAGRPPGVAAYAGLGFLVSGTSSLLGSMFPVLAVEYAGLSPAQVGLLYLLTPALALTGPLWGRASDRASDRGRHSAVLSVRSGLNAGSALVLLVAPTLVGVWLARALDDLGKAAYRPVWGSMMAEVSGRDPATRARAMGRLTAGEDAGDVVAPVVAGLLWSIGGPVVLLLARVGLALVTEVYAAVLGRRSQARPGLAAGEPSDGDHPDGRGRAGTFGTAVG